MAPNFYEEIGAAPNASSQEIATRCEEYYHHWRRLVTHHDQTLANEANQALTRLEKIREILMNPERRAAYDLSVGQVGGLTDPSASPRNAAAQFSPPPPPPKPSNTPAASIIVPAPLSLEERVDLWLCPKCKHPNAIGSTFCKKCGQTIGVICPNCRRTVEAAATFCVACGVNVPLMTRRNGVQSDLTQKQKNLATIEAVNPRKGRAELITTLRVATIAAGAWTFLSLMALASVLFSWDQSSDHSLSLTALAFPAIRLLSHFLAIGILTLLWKRISLSALLALVTGFVFFAIPFAVQQIAIGLPLANVGVLGAALSFVFLAGMYFLALIGLSLTLSRDGCSIGLVVLAGILLAALSPIQQLVRGLPLVLAFQNYASISPYFWLGWPVSLVGHLGTTLCFAMLALLAWRKTQRVEYELAIALDEKSANLRRAQGEVAVLVAELTRVNQLLVRN